MRNLQPEPKGLRGHPRNSNEIRNLNQEDCADTLGSQETFAT